MQVRSIIERPPARTLARYIPVARRSEAHRAVVAHRAPPSRRLPQENRMSGRLGPQQISGCADVPCIPVRAAEGDGRVGTHHERRHRVVRVLVTDGEVSLARVSRVWGLPWILAILSSS